MKAVYLDQNPTRVLLTMALSTLWKNAPLSPVSPVRYAEVAEPELPGPNWVKLRNKMCGLCGSDIHLMFLDISPKIASIAAPATPGRMFLGHELVGEVIETGDGAREFSRGDRVVLKFYLPSCFQGEAEPKCPMCREGQYAICANRGFDKIPENPGAGFSPVMVAHKSQLVKIDNDISDREAVMIEPYAVAVRAVLRRPPQDGERALVIGTGTIGLCLVAVLRAINPNAEVYATSRYDHQAQMAKRLGAKGVIEEKEAYPKVAEITGGRYMKGMFNNEFVLGGFDVIYDSVGSDGSINNALRWVRGDGTVVLVGANFNPKHLEYTPLFWQEVSLVGTQSHGVETFRGKKMSTFEVVLALHKEGKIDLSGFVTHTFEMNEYRKAVNVFLHKGKHKSIKVALTHS
jgi:L-iditol 2-dehydrogenase